MRVYHIAEADNWPSIERDGLLSARALFERAGARPEDRAAVEQHRPVRAVLSDGTVIRDQSPMPPAALKPCLRGVTPTQWYALLNGKVFFWFDEERVARHLHACRRTAQIVLTIDAGALLARHAVRAAVAPFNTGNARRKPAVRGRATFVPWLSWQASGWRAESDGLGTSLRASSHKPAELTIDHAVPDILDFVVARRAVAASAHVGS
ncbi:MAG: hypothetical protein KF889_24640 [Alphaproteobacteria bacterium]|nr:hypothetical protein [Alphaproteobacteria bacterium]MCW5742647.1 hypothetical protein [Alphaproteobacteria bacterium]